MASAAERERTPNHQGVTFLSGVLFESSLILQELSGGAWSVIFFDVKLPSVRKDYPATVYEAYDSSFN